MILAGLADLVLYAFLGVALVVVVLALVGASSRRKARRRARRRRGVVDLEGERRRRP